MAELGLFGEIEETKRTPASEAPTRHTDPETSHAAATVAAQGASAVADWLVAFVREMGTVTQEEAVVAYQVDHPDVSDSTIRGRFKELETSGDLKRTGERVRNARNNVVELWAVTK
jgi:hypothetical protein